MENNSLQHHGIKGMRWGVRRTPDQLGQRASGKSKEQKQSEKQKRADVKTRGVLSTEQLNSKIKRLRLEKELRELTDEEVNRGKKATEDILGQIGKQTATRVASTVLAGAALYGAKAIFTKDFNVSEFANAIFNGGPKKK